MTTKKAHCT